MSSADNFQNLFQTKLFSFIDNTSTKQAEWHYFSMQ